MRNMGKGEVKACSRDKYNAWIANYGLKNAMKIHAELGRMLRGEKKRRIELEGK